MNCDRRADPFRLWSGVCGVGASRKVPSVEDPLAKLPELTELLLIGAELREQPGLREHVGQALERAL